MRFRFLLISLAAATTAHGGGEPLTGDELKKFLGPVSPELVEWTHVQAIDFDLYYGKACPPLNGHIGFYLGGWPDFKPEPGSTVVPGRLGKHAVKWHRSITEDGSVSQSALLNLDYYWKVDISITGTRQADVDQLIAIVSQLPTFTDKLEGGLTALEYYGSIITAGIVFFVFLGTLFLTSFQLNKRWRNKQLLPSRRFFLLTGYTGLFIIVGTAVATGANWILLVYSDDGLTFVRFDISRGIILGTVAAGLLAAVSLLVFAIIGTVAKIKRGTTGS